MVNTTKHKRRKLNYRRIALMSLLPILVVTLSITLIHAGNGDPHTITTHYAVDLVDSGIKGYVNANIKYGEFPQTKLDEMDSDYTLLTTGTDGTEFTYDSDKDIYTVSSSGNRYVKENGVYYKIEPIEWRILKIDYDETTGEQTAFLISEKALESKYYDVNDDVVRCWDGSVKDGWEHVEGENYPSLKVYLNSTSNAETNFSDKGFIAKAFGSDEKLNDILTYPGGNNDVYYDTHDLVKVPNNYDIEVNSFIARYDENFDLITDKDKTYDSILYGMEPFYATSEDIDNNKRAVATDYALSNYGLADKTLNNEITYMTDDRNSKDYCRVVGPTGISNYTEYITNKLGVRPVISLDITDMQNDDMTLTVKEKHYYNFITWKENGTPNSNTTNPLNVQVKDFRKYQAMFKQENDKSINGVSYTNWMSFDTNDYKPKSYLLFGNFPKDEVKDQDLINTLNQCKKNYDDTVVFNGEKYVYEKEKYYKFDQIEWRVLDVRTTDVLALSNNVLEARQWNENTISGGSACWDGTVVNGSTIITTGKTPTIRANLNDNTLKIFTAFNKRGFLNKAFNEKENDLIKDEQSEYIYLEDSFHFDGLASTSDKIRLLSYYEMNGNYIYGSKTGIDICNKYGFVRAFSSASVIKKYNYLNNRIAFANDYAVKDNSNPSHISTYDGKTSMIYFTKSESRYVNSDGGMISSFSAEGVRPVMTLDVSNLTPLNGDGSEEDPYNYERKLIIMEDDLIGYSDVRYYEPGKNITLVGNYVPGNEVLGWYEGTTQLTPSDTLNYTMTNDVKTLSFKTNVTLAGVSNAITNYMDISDSTTYQTFLTALISDLRYREVINGVDDTGDVFYIYDEMKDKEKEMLVKLIYERIKAGEYNLTDEEKVIKFKNDIRGTDLIKYSVTKVEPNFVIKILNYDLTANYSITYKEGYEGTVPGSINTPAYNGTDEFLVPIDDVGSNVVQYSITYKVYAYPTASKTTTLYSSRVFVANECTLTYNTNGGNAINSELKIYGTKLNSLPTPTKSGYDFKGWYLDSELNNKVTDDYEIKENITIYAKWERHEEPSGGGGGSNNNEPKSQSITIQIIKYNAYLTGYDDNTIKPDNNIKRSEISALLARISENYNPNTNYRLYAQVYNDYKEEWYDNYIGYARKENILKGYDDGSFKADNYMTRGEFCEAIVRKYNLKYNYNYLNSNPVSDIDNAWYKDSVNILISNGFINGYPDGTFKGDKNITRAEVCKVLNLLEKRPLRVDENLFNSYKDIFNNKDIDVDVNEWYYKDLVDAATTYSK